MPFDLPKVVKDHPALVVGGVVVAGIAVFALAAGGNSSNASVATGTANATVNAQLAAQAMQENAALQATNSNNATQVALAQLQGNDAITAAQIAAESTSNTNDIDAALATYQTQVQQTLGLAQIQTGLAETQIASNTTLGSAQINANVVEDVSGNATQVELASINSKEQVALGAQSVAKQASSNQLLGGLLSFL